MKNLVIAIIIVIAGSLTFLLIQKLNIKEVEPDDATMEQEEQVSVASGEYLDYDRFDPQYYTENRIVYVLLDSGNEIASQLDSDINSNMLSIPEGMVLVKIEGENINELRSNLSLTTDTTIVEVDNSGSVINVLNGISSLSQLLGELGY
ncbi:MAG TPA: hypothetical protein PKU95_03095 [Candidatus Dojkabacteria bacterium]|jgi:FlaG/FlaF family flagellin (archaellin)|nr:hypothetical protein [Candidatus Dojkabacteria bacterium]